MKPVLKGAILALPIMLASSCSNQQGPQTSPSPPARDLVCPSEPDAAAMLAADPTGLQFDIAVRAAGEECRRALARVCRWHKKMGADVVCPLPLPGETD
jgi:hypothetical protein